MSDSGSSYSEAYSSVRTVETEVPEESSDVSSLQLPLLVAMEAEEQVEREVWLPQEAEEQPETEPASESSLSLPQEPFSLPEKKMGLIVILVVLFLR
jgi:hypothetical protein